MFLTLLQSRATTTTGVLVGSGTTVVGAATRSRVFTTSGALVGAGASVTGIAARFRTHTTEGVLTGPGAVVVGAADSTTARVATGVLTGPGTTIVSSARRDKFITSSGALAGLDSTVLGSARRDKFIASSGVLAGLDSAIQGAADRQAYDLTITREMATQLYQIYLLHGLTAGSPLVVAPTTRSAGGLVQSVSQTGGTVSIATTANTTTGLPSLVQMIDELAALHGLGETLSVTATSRTAGAISQTVTTTGGVTTVTRV